MNDENPQEYVTINAAARVCGFSIIIIIIQYYQYHSSK